MKSDLTELVIILDTSGSMVNVAKDMEGAINNLLEEQKKEPGQLNVTLTKFSNSVNFIFDNKNVNEVQPISLNPGGFTALYDAIGLTVDNVGRRLNTTLEQNRPSKVIVAIVTDGDENNSRTYSSAKVKELIEQQRNKYSWTFTFLGADHDAILAARAVGIDAGNAANYVKTSAGIGNLGKTFSGKMSAVRGMTQDSYNAAVGGGGAVSYTQEDRDILNSNV